MPMEMVVTRSMSDRQFTMYLLSAFAASRWCSRRSASTACWPTVCAGRVREIGIRMALGAGARGVVRMVVADALRPTLIGIVVGLAAAVAIRRVIASFLFGVKPGDPRRSLRLRHSSSWSPWLRAPCPAYSATRIDPNLALRDE